MKYLLLIGIIFTLGCEATEDLVSEIPIDELLFLYEEEKVAMDIYNHFEELYEITPFVHISDSEARHFETLENLLLERGVLTEETVIRNDAGVFTDPELQTMYDELIERGDVSLLEALDVSAYIEEHDIQGLEQLAEVTEDEEVVDILTNLASASKNHLRAFVRNLDMRDVVYEPVLLDESYFNSIISARQQCCQGGGHGKGQGHGKNSKKSCDH